MKPTTICSIIAAALISLLALYLFSDFGSSEACDELKIRITSIENTVLVKKENENEWNPAEKDKTYCADDSILTKENSRATLVLNCQSSEQGKKETP